MVLVAKTTAKKVKRTTHVGMTLVPHGRKHGGRTPEEWLELWSKWFVKNDRDAMNENENVRDGYVMLRGQMRSGYDTLTSGYDTLTSGYDTPLVLPLNINSDTIICFPLLCTLSSKTWEMGRKSDLDTDAKLKKDAEKDNDYRMMHSVSVTFDGDSIIDWSSTVDQQKVVNRAVTTPPFNIDVDPGDWNDYEGPLKKEIDGIVLTPGKARALCNGTLFLAKLESRESAYVLRFRAGGVRKYSIHAIYTIKVK